MEAVELKRMGLTRREFLTAALGAAGAAACRSRPLEPRFGGRLLGQGFEAGHLLREGVSRPPSSRRKVGVAILGAGPSGLSAAWRLARAGMEDFVVLELEPEAGGTSARGPAYPWGAHYVPVPAAEDRSLVRLLEEMGAVEGVGGDGQVVAAEHVLCRAPQERLFYRGRWYEGLYPQVGATGVDLANLRAFQEDVRRWAARRGAAGRPAFALPIARCAMDEELLALDRLSMAEYLDRKGWRSPRLRWYVDYACRDDYGLRLEQTSAWAGLHYYASRLDNPRRESAEVLTWPEGNGRVVAHLAGACGARLRTGALVCGLAEREGGVEVRVLDVASGAVEALEAERVIAALPKFVLRRLLPGAEERFASYEYGSWVVANVHLRDRPPSRGFPMAWDNVLYQSESLGYVVATHQEGRDHGPTVWTWYLPLAGERPREVREALLAAPWERWAEAVVADLAPAHEGLVERIERIDVWRWGHAMPRPEVGFLRGGARARDAAPIGRVHLAHGDLSGLALLEEAHHHGVRAAEEVLAARGVGFETFL